MKRGFLSFSIMVFALTLAMSSCKGESGNASAADSTAVNPDEQPAEIAEGKFRPDTAKVFFEGAYDAGSAFVVISKRELRLNVYATVNGDTTLIARYPVCLTRLKGQKEKEGDMKTPSCTMDEPFTISEIKDASTWVHDFGDGRGPILAYGKWFLRLETPHKGIGIHGNTGNEDKMPGRDSEGCIRLSDSDIIHFKEHYAEVGMKVVIKDENEPRYPFETNSIR